MARSSGEGHVTSPALLGGEGTIHWPSWDEPLQVGTADLLKIAVGWLRVPSHDVTMLGKETRGDRELLGRLAYDWWGVWICVGCEDSKMEQFILGDNVKEFQCS